MKMQTFLGMKGIGQPRYGQFLGKGAALGQPLDQFVREYKSWCEREKRYWQVWDESIKALGRFENKHTDPTNPKGLLLDENAVERHKKLLEGIRQDEARYHAAQEKEEKLSSLLRRRGCEVDFFKCKVECPTTPAVPGTFDPKRGGWVPTPTPQEEPEGRAPTPTPGGRWQKPTATVPTSVEDFERMFPQYKRTPTPTPSGARPIPFPEEEGPVPTPTPGGRYPSKYSSIPMFEHQRLQEEFERKKKSGTLPSFPGIGPAISPPQGPPRRQPVPTPSRTLPGGMPMSSFTSTQFSLGGFRPGASLGQGPFLIPPSFGVDPQIILEPLRDAVRKLLAQLPPDQQAAATDEYSKCNLLAAREEYEESMECFKSLGEDLAIKVREYQKIPLEPGPAADDPDEPIVSPWVWGAVGAAALVAVFAV